MECGRCPLPIDPFIPMQTLPHDPLMLLQIQLIVPVIVQLVRLTVGLQIFTTSALFEPAVIDGDQPPKPQRDTHQKDCQRSGCDQNPIEIKSDDSCVG